MFRWDLLPAYIDNAVMLLSVAISSTLCILHPKQKRWEQFFLCSLLSLPLAAAGPILLEWLASTTSRDYDLYLYRFDVIFGNPSQLFGELYERLPQLWLVSRLMYTILPGVLSFLTIVYFIYRPLEDAVYLYRVLLINALLGLLLYIVFPACGPRYAFPAFPTFPAIPTRVIPHPVHLHSAPNAMPSLHTSFAIIIWYFARRWHIGTALSVIYGAFIVWDILGTGEHYLADILAAIPYTALLLYLGGYTRREVETESATLVEGAVSSVG